MNDFSPQATKKHESQNSYNYGKRKRTGKSKRRGIELNPLNDDPDRIEEEIAEEQQEALALASASMGIGETAAGNEAENGEQ